MAKKSLLDSIDVPEPCPKKWDEMIGDQKTRLCQSCDKNIYNISEMTRGEVRKLLFQSKEKVCIRLEKDSNGTVQTLKKQLHKITRQVPIAAGVLSASLTFSALTYAQGEPVVGRVKLSVSNKKADKTFAASISGIVSDANGAVIPGAAIILRDTKNNSTRNTKSNDEGFYEFTSIEKSAYEIEADSPGFKKFISANVIVKDKVKGKANLRMNIILKSPPPFDHDYVIGDGQLLITEPAQIGDKVEKQKTLALPAPKQNLFVLGLFPGIAPKEIKKTSNKNQINTSQISFTVYDPNGAVVPNVTVELTNQKTNQEFTVSTDRQGVARFSLIPQGLYDLLVTSSIGFREYKQTIQIKQAIEPNIKITLDVGMTTGVVVVDWSEIPMFRAIAQDYNDAVRQQINQGFDVDTKDKSGETALHVAVQHGNLEIVRFLLDKGAKINIKDKEKRTAILMIADSFADDKRKIARLLISNGANVDAQNDDNETLLMWACNENVEITKILLEAGANPNLKDKDGDTALSMTVSDEIKRLLKQYGARVNIFLVVEIKSA